MWIPMLLVAALAGGERDRDAREVVQTGPNLVVDQVAVAACLALPRGATIGRGMIRSPYTPFALGDAA